MGKVSKSLKIRIMNQNEVLEFDGFRVERESFLGGDCYGRRFSEILITWERVFRYWKAAGLCIS